jgi:hypothetical protein
VDRNASRAALASVAVLLLGACGSVEPPDGGKGVEPLQSHVTLTRPDGSTLTFDDLAITCAPRYYEEGTPAETVEVRSDVDGAAPRFFIQAPAGDDRTFALGDDLSFDDDDRRSGAAIFIGEDRGEWSGQEEKSAGEFRVTRAACEPEPALTVSVDGRLQDETSERTAAIDVVLDVTAGQINPKELVDPPGSTAIATRADGSEFGLAPAYADCSEGRVNVTAMAGIDPQGRQPVLVISAPLGVLRGRHELPFTFDPNDAGEDPVPALYLDEGGTQRTDSRAGATGTITADVSCGARSTGEVTLDVVLVGSSGPVQVRGRLVLGASEPR